jgi:hypothetical protein
MALSPLGVLDLSIVTDILKSMLETCVANSQIWQIPPQSPPPSISVSGSMPEVNRKDAGCTLSLCLVHVAQDKYQRNFVAIPPPPSPPLPPPQRALLIPSQPMSLNLYYLLTAFDSNNSYVTEQQAMSIALKCFHETPIVQATIPFPAPQPAVPEEFTLTMEMETSDEVARLWQAITVPYRLSVFYKVSVVFISPPAPPAGAKQAVRFSLAVDPASFPYAKTGQVIGTSSSATFTSPNSSPANPEIVTFDYSPAVVAPSPAVITPTTPPQRVFLYGAGLNQKTSSQVYLLSPPDYQAAQEIEVTAWMAPAFDPNPPQQTDSRIVLDIPSTIGGPLPGDAPPPGIYQLLAGSDVPGFQNRTNATPFSIAARIDVGTAPPNPPILSPVGLTYTVQGTGFFAQETQVLLETLPLEEVLTPTPPGAGQFSVTGIGTIVFQKPNNIAPGLYGLRIRVNQVESPPSWWIQV